MRARWLLVPAVLAGLAGSGRAGSASLAALDLSSGDVVTFATDENGPPVSSFECSGRIYGRVALPKDAEGRQAIEAVWIRPDGGVQEKTSFEVTLGKTGPKRASMWLEFPRRDRRIFDEFSLKPGRADNEFDGGWTLKVRRNGRDYARGAFTVVCGN